MSHKNFAFKNEGKQIDEIFDKLVGGVAFVITISLLSIWVDYVLSFLLLLIKDFLQIFIGHIANSSIQWLLYQLLMIIEFVVAVIDLLYLWVAPKNYEKKALTSSSYITLLLFIPLILGLLLFSIEVETMLIVNILLFFIFFLLYLCLKHPILDILLLIWFAIISILSWILMLSWIGLLISHNITLIPKNYVIALILIIPFLALVLWGTREIKENLYLFCWDDVPKNNTKLIKFLKDDLKIEWVENAEIKKTNDNETITVTDKNNNANSIKLNKAEKKVTLEIPGGKKKEYILKEKKDKQHTYKKLTDYLFFDMPEFRLINRIYIITILTITLFTLGTIFIYDFTHTEYYKELNNITNKDMSDMCNIYSENSINATNETLPVGNNYLSISSLCKQYEQDKKDFVTYFSALIGAVIAFFITMYEKFIRNKEKIKNDKEQE